MPSRSGPMPTTLRRGLADVVRVLSFQGLPPRASVALRTLWCAPHDQRAVATAKGIAFDDPLRPPGRWQSNFVCGLRTDAGSLRRATSSFRRTTHERNNRTERTERATADIPA